MTLDSERKKTIRKGVADRSGQLHALVSGLVQEQSLLGDEEGAQRIIAQRLSAAGFAVERVEPDAEAARADPYAGYPPLSYGGRSSVVGVRRGLGGGRSLHLTGHVDVVPVDDAEPWTHRPWDGVVSDGKIWGRGAGDMKGGLAAYLVAAEVVAVTCPDLRGNLVFSSVIEEECGGNGMWSVVRAGYGADGTLIGEPTNLDLVHAGTGVVWAKLTARGRAGHSAFTGGDGPFGRARTCRRGATRARGVGEQAAARRRVRRGVGLAVRDDGRSHRRRRLDVVRPGDAGGAGAVRLRARYRTARGTGTYC